MLRSLTAPGSVRHGYTLQLLTRGGCGDELIHDEETTQVLPFTGSPITTASATRFIKLHAGFIKPGKLMSISNEIERIRWHLAPSR